MDKIFMTGLTIDNVRHLRNIEIPLSGEKAKHLILTGKNGSGKTSTLEAMSCYLNFLAIFEVDRKVSVLEDDLKWLRQQESGVSELEKTSIQDLEDEMNSLKRNMEPRLQREAYKLKSGVKVHFNQPLHMLVDSFQKGQFILAYYKDERTFYADKPRHIEKIELKDKYMMSETPRQEFIKYLADLRVTEALARNSGKHEKADAIMQWFTAFQELLQRIFGDPSLGLIFEEDTFSFSIKEENREVFDFNTLASGFAAILDIVVDLMMRMMKSTGRSFEFNMPGIVLIDEVETHLHLELQKTILDILTTVFPNIQFIMSTHSPFILNSLQNVVIYDLEKNMIVENGLTDIPYSGIVEGYFQSSELSDSLKEKFERYKILTSKQYLSDDDFEEIAELEMFLNEIPDYLALGITTEYQRIKMEFENREDL